MRPDHSSISRTISLTTVVAPPVCFITLNPKPIKKSVDQNTHPKAAGVYQTQEVQESQLLPQGDNFRLLGLGYGILAGSRIRSEECVLPDAPTYILTNATDPSEKTHGP